MAKKAKKLHSSKGAKLEIVNPDAAGIDIADTELQVCVPADRDAENNRRFGSFTVDLCFISGWLKACHITTVAMEATGIYWIPLFLKLQSDGFDVILTNARDIKNISEKKTDESDAEWIMLLHSYGLLKASFQPNDFARTIRNLSRHRNNLQQEASKAVLHQQKALEQMNIKLTTVISDILGSSGQAIIHAILAGNHDPEALALLVDPRCKASREDIVKSLEGTWDEDHLFELKQCVDQYRFFLGQIAACDEKIEQLMETYASKVDMDMVDFVRTGKAVCKKNATSIDAEKFGFAIWGVNLMEIPGISKNTVLQLIGELGHDFVEKFDSPSKFCRWCNIVPNTKISGGKVLSSRVPRKKNPVGQILRVCANTLSHSKDELGCYFRRMKARGGYNQAIVATAHKLAKIIYVMVRDKVPYDATKIGPGEEELLKRKIESTQRALDRLKSKLSNAA